VYLVANGTQIRSDFIMSMTQRSDLVPIPKTLEATIRYDDKIAPFLAAGQVVTTGLDKADYRIVMSVPAFSKDQQGGRPMAAISISAYLDKCAAIGARRRTAVVKENATLSDIYSACGATARVDSDFPVSRFTCLTGNIPSVGIARILQEEGGAIYWTGKSLKFARLTDLVNGPVVSQVSANTTTTLESAFLESHEIPWFYSTDQNGAAVLGDNATARTAMYAPRKDARVLNNMTRCLVLRRTMKSMYREDIGAGAVFQVDGVPHVVVTAAHVYSTGTDGSPDTTYSKFWLGTL
jgi:hypothetical protein